ncbi:MAG: hypothetical protein U0793_13950 [Gemmataceae bacterium]
MRYVVPFLAVFAVVTPAPAQPGPLPAESLIRAQEWLRVLGFELTLLERETIPTIATPAVRSDLAAHVARLQVDVAALDRALFPGAPSGLGLKAFVVLDKDLHRLVEAIDAAPVKSLALRHAGKRLAFADTQLGGIFAGGDASDDLFPIALKRQTIAFQQAAADLLELTRLLPGDAVSGRIRENTGRLNAALAAFGERLDRGESRKALRLSYFAVDAAWQRVAWDINPLPEALANRVILAARRCDHLNDRLTDLLKLEGGSYLLREGNPAVRTATALLQGAWFLNGFNQNGKLVSGPKADTRLIFSGHRWFRETDKVITNSGTYKLVDVEPGVAAKMELTITSGPEKGRVVPVLIRMEGNLLRYAYFLKKAAYPTGFITVTGDNMASYTWRRVE